MGSTTSKERTVAALGEVWASIGDLLTTMDGADWHRPSPLPGWDVQDNVAHVIGTELMLLGHDAPPVVAVGGAHVRNDIGAFNEAWVASMRDLTPAAMIARFGEVTDRRRRALGAMTHGEWDADALTPAGPSTYGRFMQIRVFDCWLHEQDIRDAIGRPGHESGLAVDVTLDEMTTALGYVIGKRAGVAAGHGVTFALTDAGALVRRIDVEVGDRARVVPELTAPATVTLTMPVGVMTRLAAGRTALDEVRERITVDGDAATADAVLGNLAYTI